VALTFVAVDAIFFSATRYRAPMEFALLFYAGIAIDHLVALAGRGTVVSTPLLVAMHPRSHPTAQENARRGPRGWLPRSSLKYSRNFRSSRFGSGAPRRPRCDNDFGDATLASIA